MTGALASPAAQAAVASAPALSKDGSPAFSGACILERRRVATKRRVERRLCRRERHSRLWFMCERRPSRKLAAGKWREGGETNEGGRGDERAGSDPDGRSGQ